MEPIKILEAAARRECGVCGGEGAQDFGDHVETCGACDGTGVWLPMLSKECIPCAWAEWIFTGCVAGAKGCNGTGRILNLDDPEALDSAAEKLGYTCSRSWLVPIAYRERVGGTYGHSYQQLNARGPSADKYADDRPTAHQAAFAGVIMVAWPEVKDAPTD